MHELSVKTESFLLLLLFQRSNLPTTLLCPLSRPSCTPAQKQNDWKNNRKNKLSYLPLVFSPQVLLPLLGVLREASHVWANLLDYGVQFTVPRTLTLSHTLALGYCQHEKRCHRQLPVLLLNLFKTIGCHLSDLLRDLNSSVLFCFLNNNRDTLKSNIKNIHSGHCSPEPCNQSCSSSLYELVNCF